MIVLAIRLTCLPTGIGWFHVRRSFLPFSV
jgi:hypothetical protein